MTHNKFVEVGILLPLNKTFYYYVPEDMRQDIDIGKRVLVPFGKKTLTAFILSLQEVVEIKELKEVLDVLDNKPIFSQPFIRFLKWASEYYFTPIGEIIRTAIPKAIIVKSEKIVELSDRDMASVYLEREKDLKREILETLIKRKKLKLSNLSKKFKNKPVNNTVIKLAKEGILKITEKLYTKKTRPEYSRVKRMYLDYSFDMTDQIKCLLNDQLSVLSEIIIGLNSKKFSPFLLHGITGSGKTEVYLNAIKEVVERGEKAIILVPEISLTVQLIARFRDRFGDRIGLWHSVLSEREKFFEWERIIKGEVDVVIGARSAIFVPIEPLGIIIVDEEHDPSYKQDEKAIYNARDLAIVRAKIFQCAVVLGSATPSLESFYNAETGKFKYLELPNRVEQRPLPRVEIVDLKEAELQESKIFSTTILKAIKKSLNDKVQVMLFLNRRGFSTFIQCIECGYLFKCPNCSVSLIFHSSEKALICHYCAYKIEILHICPNCRGVKLKFSGFGTEKIEKEVKRLFPDAVTERMDSDTTTGRHSHYRILKRLSEGGIDILIGTQMIGKGHDFPNVTLAGVVSADSSLNFPDFRSNERAFQLLTQVAGRVGRGDIPGEVIIQTYNPENSVIQYAKEHNYKSFYEYELDYRKALNYPPYSRIVNFRIVGSDEKKTEESALSLCNLAKEKLKDYRKKQIEILGPARCPLWKLKKMYRWQMLIKSRDVKLLHSVTKEIYNELPTKVIRRDIKVIVDVDPINIL